MNKTLTLYPRCSPKMLTEQLTQQQLYIWLIGKLFRLFRSLDTLSNLLNMLTPMSTLSNLVETRMDKGLDKHVQVNILDEQVEQPGGGSKVCFFYPLDRLLNQIFTCGSFGGGVPLQWVQTSAQGLTFNDGVTNDYRNR